MSERKGILGYLGNLLRVRDDEVEAVLRHDERRARETVRMQRRGFLTAAAAVAAAPIVPQTWLNAPATISVGPTTWTWSPRSGGPWDAALGQAMAFQISLAYCLVKGSD